MNSLILSTIFCFISVLSFGQASQWRVAGDRLLTPWAQEVDPARPLPEYPRPQMVRDPWLNLNGLWDYAVTRAASAAPSSYDGKILVPFAIESALSGVGKRVGKDSLLWYRHSFTLPTNFRRKKVLLHFGAVDWRCEVFVNGQLAGKHEGGYDPFSFDVSTLLKRSGKQEIVVSVWDPTNDGPQPRGKQINNPKGIWYTPVTGIWQTVWLEAVPASYINSLRQTPDLDNNTLTLEADLVGFQAGDQLQVSAWEGGRKIAEIFSPSRKTTLEIADAKHWSPANPYLYDLKVAIVRGNKVIDEVKSYFGMRKISMEKDADGTQRMMLNNKFLFQYGPLDQGWWPDGLYTAPSDKALRFDVEQTREMGFNMIRKHVKVEPARWYYHCDQLGLLVWQDMPSGDMGNRWDSRPGVVGLATERDRTEASEATFKKEWKAIMDATINSPAVVVWVPFNEAWGQFKTQEIVAWTASYDPSRLINSASGGNFFPVGHIMDLHNYPEPVMPDPLLYGKNFVLVLGEFGGLGLPVEGHTWQSKDNWGYQSFTSADELYGRYAELIQRIPALIDKGLSAAVYTQTTDVEVEVNGLMSYDRKVIKMPVEKLRTLHETLYRP